MNVRKNNRGFTLVELLVSVVILGIIALSASAFMVAGTKTYSSLNYAVRLQYEAQLAMAQLQEYTVDCTKGIVWDAAKKTLYIANEDGDPDTDDAVVHMFVHNGAEDAQNIVYKRIDCDDNKFVQQIDSTTTFAVDALMAEHVKSMDVVFVGNQAKITLEMTRGNKTYSATQLIALRNQPVALPQQPAQLSQLIPVVDWSDLWDKIK